VLSKAALSQLTEEVLNIADVAGGRLLELHGSDLSVEIKPDASPVTAADYAASDIIIEALSALEPQFPVLTEESIPPSNERRGWDSFWLVDPLDGTREFIKGNGEFTVNIALVEQRQPVLGVVLAPMLGLAYYAWKDGGAHRQHSNQRGASGNIPWGVVKIVPGGRRVGRCVCQARPYLRMGHRRSSGDCGRGGRSYDRYRHAGFTVQHR